MLSLTGMARHSHSFKPLFRVNRFTSTLHSLDVINLSQDIPSQTRQFCSNPTQPQQVLPSVAKAFDERVRASELKIATEIFETAAQTGTNALTFF